MDIEAMEETASTLVASGKGVLAADESTPTMAKRLAGVGLESTEPRRRGYREILFTTEGLSEYIGGVILFDETVRQQAEDGTPFPGLLRRQGIVPGIKVDQGTRPLAGFPSEVATQGLDGLRERLKEYAALGLRFTKWRAVIHIAEGLPTNACIEANAHELARYAALSQEAGLTPIVEPEVLMDGHHDLGTCADVTERVLREVARPAEQAAGRARGQPAQAEHGAARRRVGLRRQRRADRAGNVGGVAQGRAGSRAGCPVPVRGTERRARDRAAGRDQPAGDSALGVELLVRPGAPSAGAEGMGGGGRQPNRRPGGAAQADQTQLRRTARPIHPQLEQSVPDGGPTTSHHGRKI